MWKDITLGRILALCVLFCAMMFLASTAFAAPPPQPQQPSQDTHIGVQAGYNLPNVVADWIWAQHPKLSASHLAAYAGYDFGVYHIGGTLWYYFLKAPDGIWRNSGDKPIDSAFVHMGSVGVVGPTVDISFDIKVTRRILFNPGMGLGVGFRTGSVTKYDMMNKKDFTGIDRNSLKANQVEPDPTTKSHSFMPVWPLVHIDADWTFLIDRNWFAMANIEFQTFGPSFGAGIGYQFE